MFQYHRKRSFKGTIDALTYTGIRFVRCGLEDRIFVQDMITLHKQTGANLLWITEWRYRS